MSGLHGIFVPLLGALVLFGCESAPSSELPGGGDLGSDAGSPADTGGTAPRLATQVGIRTADLTLRGTLEIPPRMDAERVPAVVLVHGSGPNSRDQPVEGQLALFFGFEIRVLKELSNQLVGNGFAALRYDKRTCGTFNQCANNDYPPATAQVTVDDFIADVEAAAEFLRQRPEIDPSRVFVVGHSQGGGLVPAVLERHPELAGGVMLAAPHRPIDALLQHQLDLSREILLENGVPPREVETALVGLTGLVEDLQGLRAGTHDGQPIAGAPDSFWRSWFDVGDRAPAAAAALDRPLLALGGTMDFNVPASEIALWQATFDTADPNPGHQAAVIDCVSHALNCIRQPDRTQIMPSDLGRSLHPALVDRMIEFLRSRL